MFERSFDFLSRRSKICEPLLECSGSSPGPPARCGSYNLVIRILTSHNSAVQEARDLCCFDHSARVNRKDQARTLYEDGSSIFGAVYDIKAGQEYDLGVVQADTCIRIVKRKAQAHMSYRVLSAEELQLEQRVAHNNHGM